MSDYIHGYIEGAGMSILIGVGMWGMVELWREPEPYGVPARIQITVPPADEPAPLLKPATTKQQYNLTVCWTLWGEARGEPLEGKRLVAATIWRDAGGKKNLFAAACRKRFRFSCWNDYVGAPAVRPELHNEIDGQAWSECERVAIELETGTLVASMWPARFHRNDGRQRSDIPRNWTAKVVGRHKFWQEPAITVWKP